MVTDAKKKVSKMKTEEIQKKLNAGSFNADEKQAAEEVLAQRGVKEAGKTASKKVTPAKKTAPEKKAAAPKKDEGEKKVAPAKKKSEKIGETKSDKMRTMLKAGKTTREIIEAFEAEQITVRYPEIRRNRLWLIEKEKWVDPHAGEKKATSEKKPAEEKVAPAKKAAPKNAAKKKEVKPTGKKK